MSPLATRYGGIVVARNRRNEKKKEKKEKEKLKKQISKKKLELRSKGHVIFRLRKRNVACNL